MNKEFDCSKPCPVCQDIDNRTAMYNTLSDRWLLNYCNVCGWYEQEAYDIPMEISGDHYFFKKDSKNTSGVLFEGNIKPK